MAILMFGSNFIPVKKYDTGDGKMTIVFHQYVICYPLNRCVLSVGLVHRHMAGRISGELHLGLPHLLSPGCHGWSNVDHGYVLCPWVIITSHATCAANR